MDEIKRKEVDRLRQIIRLQMKMQHGTNDDDDDDDDDDDRQGIVCLLASFTFSYFFPRTIHDFVHCLWSFVRCLMVSG